MAEDFDNHRRIFDGGDDLQGAGAFRYQKAAPKS
jgi:hypothetical protein